MPSESSGSLRSIMKERYGKGRRGGGVVSQMLSREQSGGGGLPSYWESEGVQVLPPFGAFGAYECPYGDGRKFAFRSDLQKHIEEAH